MYEANIRYIEMDTNTNNNNSKRNSQNHASTMETSRLRAPQRLGTSLIYAFLKYPSS